jgi:hypothetical protein
MKTALVGLRRSRATLVFETTLLRVHYSFPALEADPPARISPPVLLQMPFRNIPKRSEEDSVVGHL